MNLRERSYLRSLSQSVAEKPSDCLSGIFSKISVEQREIKRGGLMFVSQEIFRTKLEQEKCYSFSFANNLLGVFIAKASCKERTKESGAA